MKARIQILHGEPAYWCPVCKGPHRVAVNKPFDNGAIWTWNKSRDKPTFTPSVHTYYDTGRSYEYRLKRHGIKRPEKYPTEDAAKTAADDLAKKGDIDWVVVSRLKDVRRVTVCHVHVRDGKIQILSDSRSLGGQTLPLEEWELDAD